MSKVESAQRLLKTHWRPRTFGPFFRFQTLPATARQRLPVDSVRLLEEFGGNEGFLGSEFLRLYRVDELIDLNVCYDIATNYPQCFIFGSNGCGDAFGMLWDQDAVVRVPFIPMMAEMGDVVAPTICGLVELFAASGVSMESNPATAAMEVHDKHPIALGGSPTDPENKVLVPPLNHAEICAYWHRVYRHIRAQVEPQ